MYIVEGTIGAGKSTFLKCMKQYLPDITTVLEPLECWDSPEHGTSLLYNFMQDSCRWAFTMETFTMMCRVREHVHYQNAMTSDLLLERSVYSGHYVFALNGYRQGFMTEQEWLMYLHYFTYLVPHMCKKPSGFIYLRTTPEIAYERIKKRSRSSEDMISLEYLKQLHVCHEEFLVDKKNEISLLADVPVLTLDCTHDFETSPEYARQLSEQVKRFIVECKKEGENVRAA